MGLRYQIPSGVCATNIQGRPALTTTQGGKIVLDGKMLDLWQRAHQQGLEDLLAPYRADPGMQTLVCAALACLAETGLLDRDTSQIANVSIAPMAPAAPSSEQLSQETHFPGAGGPLVSAIIIGYNSRKWLENCISSLLRQTYPAIEIIVVDNGSTDETAAWLAARYSGATRLVALERTCSFACATNQGIQAAHGRYFLLLNPDTLLESDAVACLVSEIQENAAGDEPISAVAAKLRFLWAPAFLNGLGNYVGAFSWGADSALGHLDLGQFNSWKELPSACFAAALIPASAWANIGPLDENFPLYYEDSEWCYRARLLGYSVRAAPGAIVYHAFSGGAPMGETPTTVKNRQDAIKLQRVVYGRLRFITKVLAGPALFRFLVEYLLEDCIRCLYALLRGRWPTLGAYFSAWLSYFKTLHNLWQQRKTIQAGRKISDKELFDLQRQIPKPLMWKGFPQLTWDLVCNCYAPLIVGGQPGVFPEFDYCAPETVTPQPSWQRAAQIWRFEGPAALIYHMLKHIQWRLARP